MAKKNKGVSVEEAIVAEMEEADNLREKAFKSTEEKSISITTYLSLKKVPNRHWAGMKAYTKLTRATFSEWENTFKTY